MKKLTIILDAAHGEETPGKRSPDGRCEVIGGVVDLQRTRSNRNN